MGPLRFKRLALFTLLTSLITTDLGCTKDDGSKSVSVFGEGTYTTGKTSAAAFENFIRSFATALGSACGGTNPDAMCFLAEFCETANRVSLDLLISDPEIQSISESIRTGRSAFNETNAERYRDAFKELEKALATGDLNAAADPTLGDVFGLPLLTGAQKNGDPCYIVDECERGLICNLVSCPGRCQALPAAGEACLSESLAEEQESFLSFTSSSLMKVELCETASYCDDKTRTCLVRKGQGESCVESAECVKGHYCRSGKCLPAKKTGEACVDLIDTCDRGLVCRGGACNSPGNDGEPCAGSPFECAAGLVCRAGACRPPGAEGEPCAPLEESDASECGAGLYCAPEGKCAAKLAGGADCTRLDECKGYCEGLFKSRIGKCRDAFPAAGEACGADGECGLCAECDRKTKICLATGIGASCKKDLDCIEEELACDLASSRCAIKPVLGESCDLNVGCSTDFYCGPDGFCRSPDRFRYESCASDSQCVSADCQGRSCLSGPCRPPEIPATTAAKAAR